MKWEEASNNFGNASHEGWGKWAQYFPSGLPRWLWLLRLQFRCLLLVFHKKKSGEFAINNHKGFRWLRYLSSALQQRVWFLHLPFCYQKLEEEYEKNKLIVHCCVVMKRFKYLIVEFAFIVSAITLAPSTPIPLSVNIKKVKMRPEDCVNA